MGIDVYLKWDGMTEDDKQKQYVGSSTVYGHVGYLREAYHGGPYATKILCREAFESDNCEAEIPAAILRERLTNVTEPAMGASGGHQVAVMFAQLAKLGGLQVEGPPNGGVLSDTTCPMTVEEAVRARYRRLYPNEPVDEVVRSFQAFVALAEQKEKETGKPCTIYASY